jgi:hypothetical protein
MVREYYKFQAGLDSQKKMNDLYQKCLERKKTDDTEKCVQPEFESKDTKELLDKSHDMCHDKNIMKKLRLRAFGSYLGIGLSNIIGAGGLLGRAKAAGYKSQEDHGGLPDDETMINRMKSSLEGIKWGTFKTFQEKQLEISTDQYLYLQVIQKNADLQMEFMDNLVNYEIKSLWYGEITLAVIIITILNYILRHL